MTLDYRVVSSLEKILCRHELPETVKPIERLELLRGETGAFQVAFKSYANCDVRCVVESELGAAVTVREVGHVPCYLPAQPDDPFVISSEPGLYPDSLLPCADGMMTGIRCCWQAFWVTVKAPRDIRAGRYAVKIMLTARPPEDTWSAGTPADVVIPFEIEILPPVLAEHRLKRACWFYADTLCTYYKVAPWSEEHWRIVGNYMRNCAAHGVNMIYTPLWSTPLDVQVGHHRPLVQLLKIRAENGVYTFDFSRLERWVEMALAAGFRYVELSHLFTQWGARACPTIMADTPEGEKEIFGWGVAATSPEYQAFLTALLPQLQAFFTARGLKEATYFHVSDEPEERNLEDYRAAVNLVAPLLKGWKVIDALSSTKFVDEGLAQLPIPNIASYQRFEGYTFAEKWLYHCGAYRNNLPQRHFGMPSIRARMFGIALYLLKCDGFLNWGYNFWYTEHSVRMELDPYQETDAGHRFCGNGGSLVYPGADGTAVDSLRSEVLLEANQDLTVLQMLEDRIGREAVLALLNEGLDKPLTVNDYPHEPSWLLDVRHRVNAALSAE